MPRFVISAIVAALVSASAPAALAADRAKVAMTCSAFGAKFAYDCTLHLTNARTGAAVDGAYIVLGADMPSMPMVHNVPPHELKPTGKSGEYAARIQLDMHGPWAIKLRITGALRDEVVEVYEFGEKGAAPRGRATAAPPARPSAGGHKH
jgi:hypothetical protein